MGNVAGLVSAQKGQGQPHPGQLELRILSITGNPKSDNEVHLHLGTNKIPPHFTAIVRRPQDYDARMFKEGNRALISESQENSLALEAVYYRKRQVYPATR